MTTDPTQDFSKNLVKGYSYWEVYVSDNQQYLGRCTIWCKRTDALDLAEATAEEQVELFLILSSLRRAAAQLFSADWFNYAFLGNETRHLHGHFIPRYETPRHFGGLIFEDHHYGRNYRSELDNFIPEQALIAIRDGYKKFL